MKASHATRCKQIALKWILDEHADEVFSFNVIAEILGIDGQWNWFRDAGGRPLSHPVAPRDSVSVAPISNP